MTTTASQPPTSSAGEAYSFAPASVSGFVFSLFRFHTPTSWPTASSRCAIEEPIRPVPHTPIFIVYLERRDGSGSMEYAEILLDQRFVVENIVRAAVKDAAPRVENHGLVG